jgi:hypothetical protein
MLKVHEILGTDKPVFKEKEDNHFFLDEITYLNENAENYRVVGYVRVIKNQEIFFKAVYSKKEITKEVFYKEIEEKLIIPVNENLYKIN